MKTLKLFSVLVFSFLVILSGCKKDDETKPSQPPPVDTGTLKMSFNGAQILTTTYYTEVDPGGKAHFVWDYNGKVPFEILKNEQFFSDKVKGDTTIEIAEAITFTFLVQGNLIPQKIGVAIKGEPTPPSITSFAASSSSITRGDSIVLTLIHNGDTCAITSNPIGTLKSVSTEKVRTMKVAPTVNTRYTAESWNKYGSVFAFVDVIVNDPPLPTELDFVSSGPYEDLFFETRHLETDKWDTLPISSLQDRKYFFYEDYTYRIFSKTNGSVIGGGNWGFVGSDKFNWGGSIYNKELLDETFLKLSIKIYTAYHTDSSYVRHTYKHIE